MAGQNIFKHGGNIWQKPDPYNWLDFSVNLNPLGMPPQLRNAVKNAFSHIGFYPEPDSANALESAAAFMGVGVDNLFLTNGGIDALAIASRLLRASHVLIPLPAFCEYQRLAINNAAQIKYISPLKNENEYLFDWENIKINIVEGSLIYIANPVNPTGAAAKKEEMIDFLVYAKEKMSKVILDEAFIDYCPEYSVRKFISAFDNTLIAGSLTKFFAIPGLRLGYLYGNRRLIEKIKSQSPPWNINVLAQAAAASLTSIGDFCETSRKLNEKNKLYLRQELISLGFKVYSSFANYLLVNASDINIRATDLNHCLNKKKIIIRECSSFKGLGPYDLRVAVKDKKDNRQLLSAIRSVIDI